MKNRFEWCFVFVSIFCVKTSRCVRVNLKAAQQLNKKIIIILKKTKLLTACSSLFWLTSVKVNNYSF